VAVTTADTAAAAPTTPGDEMDRESPVREIMTTEVLTFHPDDNVLEATRQLVHRQIDAAPVVDGTGAVVGMLSSADLIVKDVKLHFPTLVNFLGVNIELPSVDRHFDEDVSKALGASVGEVMTPKVRTCSPDDTIEQVATLMHKYDVSRLPVVADGALEGIVSRNDILRAILAEP
jgi:CBS domain-containing protein